MSALLLVNPRSGGGDPSPDELCAAAAGRGIETHVLGAGDDAAEIAREAGADALGMAGGDGSLGQVAAAAVELDVPFVCIPFGTRNHFARDLGLDCDDPLGALAAFEGEERRVDVGRAGGRVFLNNASLGAYALLVHQRERHRRRRNSLARLRALALTIRSPHGLHVSIDGQPVSARIVLVANNRYEVALPSLGERERLDGGELVLYVARGFLPRSVDDRPGTRFVVDAAASRLRVALDGEPAALETPIEFTISPRALRVLVPRPG